MDNAAIAEIVEASKYTVNLYLEAGYELLQVTAVQVPIPQNRAKPDAGVALQRRVAYVMARSAAVAHFDPPTRAERMAREAASAE